MKFKKFKNLKLNKLLKFTPKLLKNLVMLKNNKKLKNKKNLKLKKNLKQSLMIWKSKELRNLKKEETCSMKLTKLKNKLKGLKKKENV